MMYPNKWAFAAMITTGTAALLGSPSLARAQESSQQCASAYEEAQRQRAKGDFREASRAAQTCSQAECNALLVQECIKLYEQIQADTPSMVFSVRNGNGEELVNVKVTVDGQLVTDHLDGRPIEMNPGLHTFYFESEGLPPLETKHTARVGDRNRLLEIVLGDVRPKTADKPEGSAAAAGSALPPAAPPPNSVPIPSIVLGGVGLLGLGTFAYFRVTGTSDYNELGKTCSPRCDPAETDKIHTKFLVSYVGLGVGAAGLGGAALWYVLTRNREESPEPSVAVVPTHDGIRAQWQARF
ncbi:MAG TPA: hypothetical protein VFQ61_37085 [Polyangiaceae bacterium]|nr:hypothetical protein [Polyangiaceae bacterium]